MCPATHPVAIFGGESCCTQDCPSYDSAYTTDCPSGKDCQDYSGKLIGQSHKRQNQLKSYTQCITFHSESILQFQTGTGFCNVRAFIFATVSLHFCVV